MRLGWRAAGAMYATYAAGVAALTWPLALAPGSSWPHHHDPRLFTWVMVSMARWLRAGPWALFDGNAFYPYSESLALSEPLLLPAVLGFPGFVWGNPVLTYNLLVLLLWPVNGLAMAWAAHAVTGSRAGAWLAGAVFCLSPYFAEYHLEFNMLPAAAVPVALVAWVRWLETERPRWLVLALGALVAQGLTTWYYTIVLGLGLAVVTVGFLCLRWRGWRWRRRVTALAAGGAAVGVALMPVAWPYLLVHRELGFERGLEETGAHAADLLSFVLPGGRAWLLRPAHGWQYPETSPFVGVAVLALVAASAIWVRRDRPGFPAAARLGRVALAVLGLALLGVAGAIVLGPERHRLGPLSVRLPTALLLDVAVAAGVALLLVRGWVARRRGDERRLGPGDWTRLLALLAGVAAVLALGPTIKVAGRAVGEGPYLALYPWLLPLHAIRTTVRFGVLTTAALALLAALGLRAVEERLAARPVRWRALRTVLVLALVLEYAVAPAWYDRVAVPRPVDVRLRAEPDDVAVLEWPAFAAGSDTDAMFRSLYHGKRIVNGHSGFNPEFLHELSALLSTPGPPFPTGPVEAALRRIYPLRYLVVRLGAEDMEAAWRARWLELRRAPSSLLRFQGTHGADDLYELAPLPERGARIERWVSHDFLRRHPMLELALAPLASGTELEQFVEVRLNGRIVERVRMDAPASARVGLVAPLRRVEPNVIVLEYGYTRPASARDARYRIGGTGALSPGDLWVRSAGQPYGSVGSIRLNGEELSPDRRGYNLVALDAEGRPLRAEVFDTFFEAAAAARLGAWIEALPPGTIVAGAVKDEASGRLTGAAVEALGTLGVAGDLRERFRESHAFVGVKGARPGTAAEALGPQAVEVALGRPEAGEGVELTAFRLTAR